MSENGLNMIDFVPTHLFFGISILVQKCLWTSLIVILSTLCIFAWRLLKCKKLIVANKQVTKLFYFSWMTSSTSLCRAPTISQPKDLLETHLDHCWGPHWWFDALKSVTVLHFGRFRHAWNWGEIGPFGACRKWPKSNTRTDFSASNHQGGHQQLSRWVRTKSTIVKSFSDMLFKIGRFPHWNSY